MYTYVAMSFLHCRMDQVHSLVTGLLPTCVQTVKHCVGSELLYILHRVTLVISAKKDAFDQKERPMCKYNVCNIYIKNYKLYSTSQPLQVHLFPYNAFV